MLATGFSTWKGSWKTGEGMLSSQSQTVMPTRFSFKSRFEGSEGGSPEELLAVAHAGCYNQALANILDHAGIKATHLNTTVSVDLGFDENGHPIIKSSFIKSEAQIDQCNSEAFQAYAEKASRVCAISRLINCPIVLQAHLIK